MDGALASFGYECSLRWRSRCFACCEAYQSPGRQRRQQTNSGSSPSASTSRGGSSSESSADIAADILGVLGAEQTTEVCYLETVVMSLAQQLQLQPAAASDTVTSSSSSFNMATGGSSSSGTATSSRRRSQKSKPRAASSVSGQQWLPAALAPTGGIVAPCQLHTAACWSS